MKSSHWQSVLAFALSVACVGIGDASSQPPAPGLTLNTIVGHGPGAFAKSYNVGGMISVSGNVQTSISNPDGTVMMAVDRIRNDSTTTTSGALRLRLFVSSVPFADGVAFFTIGEAALDPLMPQNSYDNFRATVPLSVPPNGVYYLNIGVFEREEGCTIADGFCPDTAATYPSRVQAQDGMIFAYPGDSPITTAVEYYHAEFDHYFFTAIADEISKLDSGFFAGWSRTGRTFGIWTSNAGGKSAVCRFFSDSFAPKSSHFYTPVGEECAIVKSNPRWDYEGIVAYLELPNSDGSCAIGIPLYRLYNDGMGGAPNHRYTTSLSVRAAMNAAGWIPEGSGIGVIGCVPY